MLCIYTPQGVPVALFLTSHSNFLGSKSVKTKAYSYAFYVYVPTLAFPRIGASGKDSLRKGKHYIGKKKQKMINQAKKVPTSTETFCIVTARKS